MFFKNIKFWFLIIATIFTTSSVAIADSLTSNGTGGNYKYQLWRTTDGTRYYLKIWRNDSNPNSEPSQITHSFESTRDALEHFDCYYAEKSLPSCPRQ
jgi:hypothetical protein